MDSGEYALSKCFENKIVTPNHGTRDRTPHMLKCCPTDDQAEVMIYYKIPVDYFLGIAFESKEIAQIFVNEANKRNISYPNLYIFPELSALYFKEVRYLNMEDRIQRYILWNLGKPKSMVN